MKVRIHVSLKPGVLDPQGRAVHHALEGLGFEGVQDVRIGRLIELDVADGTSDAALDDFGTGYASLSHLKQFPVDLLKIDRSFVQDLGRSRDAEAITAAVINLGHCLGMEVVAEGVETVGQQTWLAHLGCDTGQGFLYSPAIPAAEVPLLPFAPGRPPVLQLTA